MTLCKIIPPHPDTILHQIFGPFTFVQSTTKGIFYDPEVLYRFWRWNILTKQIMQYPGVKIPTPGTREQIKIYPDNIILKMDEIHIEEMNYNSYLCHICLFDSKFFLVPESMLEEIESQQ